MVALRSAFQSRIVSYRVTTTNYHVNVVVFMNEVKSKIVPLLERQVSKFHSVKCNFELFGYFVLENQELEDIKMFNTKNEIATVGSDLNALYDSFTGILDEKVSEFAERESGMYSTCDSTKKYLQFLFFRMGVEAIIVS